MPKAIYVRESNIPYILKYGHEREMNLDYIKDNMDYAQDFGQDLYLVTDGDKETNNVVFTTFWGDDFNTIWKFTEKPKLQEFTEIERV